MKGVVAGRAVRFLRKWRRTQPAGLALGLTDSAEALLATEVMPSSWYPYEDYLEVMECIRVNVMDGSLERIADLAAAGAPIVYGGAHRMLIHDDDPRRTIGGIEALWGTCHDFGTPTVDAHETEATVRIADALPMSEIEGFINMGWIRGVLEVAGVHDLRCEIREKPWEGAKEQVIHYRWA